MIILKFDDIDEYIFSHKDRQASVKFNIYLTLYNQANSNIPSLVWEQVRSYEYINDLTAEITFDIINNTLYDTYTQ
jgi:hypothetical protein